MIDSRLACVGLLLQWAMQASLAGTLHQFGTALVYSTVDSDGVTLFTNIPPPGGALAPGLEPEVIQGRTSPPQTPANDPVSHVMVRATKVQALPRIEPPAGGAADETALDEIPPQLRDGGPPPDDH